MRSISLFSVALMISSMPLAASSTYHCLAEIDDKVFNIQVQSGQNLCRVMKPLKKYNVMVRSNFSPYSRAGGEVTSGYEWIKSESSLNTFYRVKNFNEVDPGELSFYITTTAAEISKGRGTFQSDSDSRSREVVLRCTLEFECEF